jgi:DNA-binding response OmpR family regulator
MARRVKVLVADDDPNVLLMTSMILESGGYRVLEAATGKECLESVRLHRPDIVLLDVILPDMSGVDVCCRIKHDEASRRTLVMLVSGVRVSPEYQAEGLDGGADAYIVKPLTSRELLARVQSMVRIKLAEDKLLQKEKEQEKLIEKLREALAEVKTLKGLIPICAWCKNIRDDKGYWERLEAYISKHTDAVFTHSICPSCLEKHQEEIKQMQIEDFKH